MVTATVVLFLGFLGFGAGLDTALLRAMSFMIVASPCAVVLATMPPLLAAIANAGRHGVLVKSAVVMKSLGAIDLVAFDKTGTTHPRSLPPIWVWRSAGTDPTWPWRPPTRSSSGTSWPPCPS